MSQIAKPRFAVALSNMLLAERGASGRKQVRDAFFKAFLEFGSETPDNLSCARHVDYGLIRKLATSRRALGLRSKVSRIPLSEFAWNIEGTKIPARIRLQFPKLTVLEWE